LNGDLIRPTLQSKKRFTLTPIVAPTPPPRPRGDPSTPSVPQKSCYQIPGPPAFFCRRVASFFLVPLNYCCAGLGTESMWKDRAIPDQNFLIPFSRTPLFPSNITPAVSPEIGLDTPKENQRFSPSPPCTGLNIRRFPSRPGLVCRREWVYLPNIPHPPIFLLASPSAIYYISPPFVKRALIGLGGYLLLCSCPVANRPFGTPVVERGRGHPFQ